MLRIDDEGVQLGEDAVSWSDVQGVDLHVTSDGPFVEDVFFVLHGPPGSGVVVPSGTAHERGLLEQLQRRLPGFDNQAVIDAMLCTEDRVFRIWRRDRATGRGST